jgi:hypothetical protein
MRPSHFDRIAWCLLILGLVPESILGQHSIQLEDIVAGGDGSGTSPSANTGIDPRSGEFTTGYIDGRIADVDGVNPQPVPASPFIDSVFFLRGTVPTAQDGIDGHFILPITQSGIFTTLSDAEESGSGWNYILENRAGGVSTPGIRVGGRDFFTTSIGIHASAGITFDLDELRERHGPAAVGCFSAYWGVDDCNIAFLRLIAILSSDTLGILGSHEGLFETGEGEHVQLPIPPEARYLTLVCSTANGNDNCDHGTIARPIITPNPCPQPSNGWIWNITPSRVAPEGESVSVEGEALWDLYNVRVGGATLLDQQVLSDTFRRGRTPSLAPGVYDVDVFAPDDGVVIATLPRALEVVSPPVLTSVTPSSVFGDRATPVTIRGANFRSDMTIYVRDIQNDSNDLPLIDPRFVSENVITGSIPPLPAGQGPGPRSLLLLDQDRRREDWGFVDYIDSGIERVEPSTVSTEGGTEVTFFGPNVRAATTFRLGGKSLTGVVALDANRVRGISPALAAGTHPAELANAQGTIYFRLDGAVVAVEPAPLAIASIRPSRVFTLGGAVVTIVTTAAHRGAIPRVDGAPFVNVEVVDGVTLRGEVPPLAPGFHDIDLVDDDGEVVAAALHGLEALLDPGIAIANVSPTLVSSLGGTEVTFTGTGFSEGFIPRVGGRALDDVVVEGTTKLRGVTQPLEPGQHRAAIHQGEQRLAVWAGIVTAVEPSVPADMQIGQVRPARVTAGGSLVRFVGSSFPGGLVPRIGGLPLEGFRAVSPCRYEGRAPDLPAGFYVADFFRPGFGVVAELRDLVEVAAPGAAPKPSHIVSAPVLSDGSTRLYVFGNDFAPGTSITVGGRSLSSPVFISDELIVGNAPALGSGEIVGLRTVAASDGRGTGVLENGVRYQEPEISEDVRFVRGDPNQSGNVDLSDAIFVLGFLFLGNPTSLACRDAADADSNGRLDLTDPVYVLQFLFLGGPQPASPFPACGRPSTAALGCGSFSACGDGRALGDGGAFAPSATLFPNVKTLEESPANPLDPVLVEIAPEALEVVVRDPAGGKDVGPGDIIVGPTPLHTDAVHNGVAYMFELEAPVAGSCLSGGALDKVFRVRPARLDQVLETGSIHLKQNDLAGAKVSYHKFAKRIACDIVDARRAGKKAGNPGREKDGVCVGDCVTFQVNEPFDFVGFDDGESHLYVGFNRCEVDYFAGTEMEVEFGLGELKKFKFFSGARLDSTIQFYVDARARGEHNEEESLKSYRKDELIVLSVFGVPVIILITVEAELLVGVDIEAEIAMKLDVGAEAHFNANIGFERVNGQFRNISSFNLPTLQRLDGTPSFSLDGFASVKGYVRPEAKLFGGLYIEALTGTIKIAPEFFARVAVEGRTDPPCFGYGLFAGGKADLHPEIQFFGIDVWDPRESFHLVPETEFELLSDEVGCKLPPVVKLSRRDSVQGSALVFDLDATGSHDPDGGPLEYRWDFDADGVCDRNTGSNPRTTYVYDPSANSACRITDCKHEITLRVTDDEQTYTEQRTGFRTTGNASQIRRANVLTP